jgi:competence protein ComEC
VLCSFSGYKNRDHNSHFLRRSFEYFFEIILVSIAIQIATTPFLMRSFQNVAILGFVANVLAIPLTSFFVMPLGFLALFLMPLNLEKYALFLMEKGIFLIKKIAIFVTDLNFSHLTSPQLSSLGLVIATLGLLLICLSKSYLRFVGVFLFCLSFVTIFFDKKPDILFDGKQKFFAVRSEDGLVFSKALRPSKNREIWMKKMGEAEFKSVEILRQVQDGKMTLRHSELVSGSFSCDELKCIIEKNQKILVLLKRNKISEICRNDFDVIVNLTSKYKLPSCIQKNKIKIDNLDFYQKGGQFFYFEGGEMKIETTS